MTLFTIAPWIIGLVIATYAGFALDYLITPAFYVGSVGILLATSTLAYGSVRQYAFYERFLACFDLDEETRQEAIREALARHSNFYFHLRAAAIVFAICAFLVVSGFYFWSELEPFSRVLGTSLPRFKALSQYGWYDESIATQGALIVIIFSAFISLPLGTSGSIMIRLPLFLWRTSAQIPLLPPALIKAHFALATSFYAKVSILWLIGVALSAYFWGENKDWLSYGVVGFLFVLGVANFVVPQIAYARVVSASQDLFLDLLSNRILKETPPRGATTHDKSRSDLILRSISGSESLISLLAHDHWVYPIHQTYIVVGSYLLSLLSWDRLHSIIVALL